MDDSAAAYENHWSKYLQNRDQSSVGARVTEQWSRTLPEGAATLELACGGGYPVTRVLQKDRSEYLCDRQLTVVVNPIQGALSSCSGAMFEGAGQ